MKILSMLFITLLFLGCTSDNGDDITGKWLMHKVIQDGKDVSSEHDPHDERFLILRDDSSIESGGGPYGKNTGKYVFNSEDHTLFLDSDAGSDDDSQWKITIRGDIMHWQGNGSEWATGFELIHLRDRQKS
jgi:hypothetical protein